MRNGIAVAGNIIVDYVKELDTFPERGMLANILSVKRNIGGCVPNVLIDLAKIDPNLKLYAYGKVGNDNDGQYAINIIKKHNIDVEGIKKYVGKETSYTDVMTVRQEAERTFFHSRGANALFGIEDIDFKTIKSKILHIGYGLLLDKLDSVDEKYGTVMARALNKAQSLGIKTSMDVVSENSRRFAEVITPSLKYCDYLIINEVEASLITGISVRTGGIIDEESLQVVCEKLLDKGVKELVAVHSPETSCAMKKTGEFVCLPSLNLPEGYVNGTVGAGDTFCAGVLYSLCEGYDLKKTVKIGTGSAALSLSETNSTDGVGCLEEINDIINEFGFKPEV